MLSLSEETITEADKFGRPQSMAVEKRTECSKADFSDVYYCSDKRYPEDNKEMYDYTVGRPVLTS